MLETLWQDVRYAARSLARRPLVTAVAVISLALGIGVNTTIFSVFERLLLRRLPVPASEELVNITSPGPRPGRTSTDGSGAHAHIFSYPLFRDLERSERTGLSHIAAHRSFPTNLASSGDTARGDGLLVSGDYFSALGVIPSVGRLLARDDDLSGGNRVVVLSHRYWTAAFSADPAVVGDTLIVNGEPMTIVGVAAAGFTGMTTMEAPQVFVPLAMAARMRAGTEQRNDHWLYAFGRLQPGITRDQAQAAMNLTFTSLIRDAEFPILRSGLGERARAQFLARQIVLEDGSRGRSASRDQVRMLLVMLLAVTGLVLLIACANLAHLILVRWAGRASEMAVRLSIGASAGSIIRLVMAEACLLGLLGGAGALVVAGVALDALLAIMPVEDAALLPFELNASILLFTLALGLATSVLFGLFPAVHSLRATLANGINAHAGRVAETRAATRFRTALAVTQIALATTVLTTAGLFITSLGNLARVDLGIQRDGLIGFRLSPYLNGYTPQRTMALFERVEEELRAVPGVVSAAASSVPLLADDAVGQNVTVEGFEAGPDTNASVNLARTSGDYFGTLGMVMLAGRDFSRDDTSDAPKVAVVNEAFARQFNLGPQVVGKRLALGEGDDKVLDTEIIGLVRDAKYSQVREPTLPHLFLPYRQGEVGGLTFYVRSSSDARQLRTVIPALIRRIDPNLPVERLRTIEEQIWDNVTRDRVLATLSSWFAALATVLTGIGLYAVLACTVSRRLREIGIRMALGARPLDVRWMVLAQVGRITVVGGIIGGAIAVGAGRLAQSMLFGLDGFDARVMAGAAAVVIVVALAAGVLPARRAARVEPISALRVE